MISTRNKNVYVLLVGLLSLVLWVFAAKRITDAQLFTDSAAVKAAAFVKDNKEVNDFFNAPFKLRMDRRRDLFLEGGDINEFRFDIQGAKRNGQVTVRVENTGGTASVELIEMEEKRGARLTFRR